MTTCARSGRCSRRRRGRFSARSIGPGEICQFDLWEPQRRGPGRARPDPPRLGRRRVPGLLARRRRRADLLQADAGPAGRDRALSVVAGGAAADAGLGSPGRHPRPRRPADARSSPRSAASCGSTGTSASRRDPQAKGVVERLQGFLETQLRARPARSPTSSTSSCSSTPGSPSARTPRHAQDAALPPGRPAARGARGDGAAARRGAGHRPALGAAGPARSVPAL